MGTTTELEVWAALHSQWPYPIDRPRLANLTNLPRTTIYDCLKRLELQGRVVSFSLNNYKRGRPGVYYFSVPLREDELTQNEWDRIHRAQEEIRSFFMNLSDETRLYCMLKTQEVPFGEVEQTCRTECGLRIQCVKNNQGGFQNAQV